MSNAKQAADQIKSFAGRLKGFLEAADYLDKIGDIEQLEKESILRKDQAIKAEAEAKFNLSVQEKAIQAQEARMKNLVAEGEKEIDAGRKKNEAAISESRNEAERIVSEAKSKKASLEKEIAESKQILAKIKEEVEYRTEELKGVRNEITKAKEQIAAFLRG